MTPDSTVLPFTTRNTALAVVAFLFRIAIGRKRIYTEDFLRNNKVKAREAWKVHRLVGLVDYRLDVENPLTSKVIKAFDEEQAAIKAGMPLEVDLPPEIVARIACRVLEARKTFLEGLQDCVPYLRIAHKGDVQKSPAAKDGSYTIEVPGYRDIRLDASDEVKTEMGLQ